MAIPSSSPVRLIAYQNPRRGAAPARRGGAGGRAARNGINGTVTYRIGINQCKRMSYARSPDVVEIMSVKQTLWDPGNIATADLAAEPPSRGLARYEGVDEQRFFGREDIPELIAFLAEQPATLPLMLVGVSGA